MKKYNPYRNIFYFYRGPSHREKRDIDKQLEDNTTKALINSLEYSNKNLLFNFFKHLNIKIKDSKVVNFDLQVGEDLSRPDALIQIDANNYFIESKIDAPLYRDQIERHLKADSTSFLICITPREKDIEIIKEIGKNNLAFITWSEVYTFFKGQLRIHKEDQTRFLINQFLNYLETINVAPFNGWNKKDFEAFLNLEDDPKRELRIRVKKKLSQYLKELEALVKNEIS